MYIPNLSPAPCVPNQPVANLNCGSGVVDVSWQPSHGALLYTAVAQGTGGFASTCSSNSTACKFNNLLCGLTYSISVTASDNVCSSAQSLNVLLDTGKMCTHNSLERPWKQNYAFDFNCTISVSNFMISSLWATRNSGSNGLQKSRGCSVLGTRNGNCLLPRACIKSIWGWNQLGRSCHQL